MAMNQQMTSKEISDALVSFGLTEKEIAVYIALLKIGTGSAYAISKLSKIKLSTSYVVLDALIDRGVVVRVPKTRKRLYTARLPYTLLENLQQRVHSFEQVMPMLAGMARDQGKGAQLLFFDGVEEIKKGMQYRLKEMAKKEIVGFYGATQHVSPELDAVFIEWNKNIASESITTRAIAPDHPSLKQYRRLDKEHNRVVKIIPYQQYTSDISVDITPFFVRLIIFSTNPQCVIIESKTVAQTFRQIFEMVWGCLPSR